MVLDDHLFRREAGRMIAVLTRLFGVHNLALVEDVVQDAFCRALDVWKWQGPPANPSAWLMMTAKNRAMDVFRRERTARTFAPELGRLMESEWTLAPIVNEAFETNAITDDQLRLMFSCCHPRLPEESQVSLILHLLCGFGTDEVAAAFMGTRAATQKRITRSKKVFATSKRLFDLDGAGDFVARLPAVQRALYLLFNEGYHGASSDAAVRADLCREAIRLATLLSEHPWGSLPGTRALLALMCLHAARLPARVASSGDLSALDNQDRSQWDKTLIAEGQRWLNLSATGSELSAYHLEAMIASVHSGAASREATDWSAIVALYDRLMAIQPTPIVALNRAIALAEKEGPEQGLAAIAAISGGAKRLASYPFYPAALGELERRRGNSRRARHYFQRAHALARNPMERRFLEQRLAAC